MNGKVLALGLILAIIGFLLMNYSYVVNEPVVVWDSERGCYAHYGDWMTYRVSYGVYGYPILILGLGFLLLGLFLKGEQI